VWLPTNFVGILVLQPHDLRRTNSAIEYSGPRICPKRSAWGLPAMFTTVGVGHEEILCVRGGLGQLDTLFYKQVYFTAIEDACDIVLCLE
jgi:hypothetical protein